MLPNGTRLENFEIVGTLGAGGFGVTYKAKDVQLENFVAIKEYFPEQFANRIGEKVVAKSGANEEFELGLKDFLKEARHLARFKHPNIVGVSRFLNTNNSAYIVMNYLPGRTLLSWLSEIEGEPPTQEELDLLTAPLLDALELVHKNRMLHRDIKLSNIIITDDGQPVLIDFGAAKEAANIRSREIGSLVTPPFSPIEQYSSDASKQGAWSDIYSLAVTLYRCMTGTLPPDAPTRIRDGDEVQMPGPEQGYRQQFVLGVEAALNLSSKKRPRSIAEFRELLFTQTALDRVTDSKNHNEINRLQQFIGYVRRYFGKGSQYENQ